MRLEAGRRGSCSFWLAGSCGHWANTARPLRPKVPPLRVHHREERQWGGTHTHTDKGDRTDSGNQDRNQKVANPLSSPGSSTEARQGCGQRAGPRVS